jgi:hypothetical protein
MTSFTVEVWHLSFIEHYIQYLSNSHICRVIFNLTTACDVSSRISLYVMLTKCWPLRGQRGNFIIFLPVRGLPLPLLTPCLSPCSFIRKLYKGEIGEFHRLPVDTSPTYLYFLMLHACFYIICLLFCYTSWHFYAFSGTNLLTSFHSASSLFSAVLCFRSDK